MRTTRLLVCKTMLLKVSEMPASPELNKVLICVRADSMWSFRQTQVFFLISVNFQSQASIDDYVSIVGEYEINAVKEMADKVKGKSVTVNSTAFGGGVAENCTIQCLS